ncbi:MAG: tRNA pseudouridine(38-40) synthase TruA [Armatimonadetes bacterium]|nr:tRNA pseudouridine(38-40) synthase TruA [Armatimonadota bacterium]
MRNVKVVVEYDGADYFGFQYQPGAPTIQGELERVLEKIVKERITIYGAGRTDTGVHAAGQVFNFRTDCGIPIDRVCIAMNTLLPRGIAAVEACEVENDFHARHSARSRLYRYDILNRDTRSALTGRYCWHVRRPLDVESMDRSAQCLLGEHDFSAFEGAGSETRNKVRNMMFVDVKRCGEQVIIELRANAFLRSMVRNIVGTLVEVGLGKRPASQVEEILRSRDRCAAGKIAPPQGLCLVEVEY